ncbi:EcsC family protein [Paenibacillus whitsoniae]|uniref:EcsC family protein n=1 Tax=Paenibacillus whitsoniae TaxID=2496558 RepID=A0A3S0CPZ8_9BACL|nr:EcsC family protein [Paenibacillus whitsoniae]RTE02372.1 EcsC family protein [Paenibacillus whitsoniae]
MESTQELRQALQDIERWEHEQKDLWFWEKIGRLPFQLLDRFTPKALSSKIGEALDELGHYVQAGGKYLVAEQGTLQQLKTASGWKPREDEEARELTIGDVAGFPLRVMEQVADELIRSRSNLATLQGATTGIGGLLTLAIDIPAVLGLSLKTIQEIAICYGYDPKEKQERIFTIKCLQFASSDIVGKKAILDELAAYATVDKANRQMMSQLQGWREVFATYRDNWGWKKLFQLIPIAGMLFGAWINRGTLNDVGEAAHKLYRKRRILERLGAQTEG